MYVYAGFRIRIRSDSVFLHALDPDPVSSFSGFGTGFSPDPVPGTKKKSAEKALKVIY